MGRSALHSSATAAEKAGKHHRFEQEDPQDGSTVRWIFFLSLRALGERGIINLSALRGKIDQKRKGNQPCRFEYKMTCL